MLVNLRGLKGSLITTRISYIEGRNAGHKELALEEQGRGAYSGAPIALVFGVRLHQLGQSLVRAVARLHAVKMLASGSILQLGVLCHGQWALLYQCRGADFALSRSSKNNFRTEPFPPASCSEGRAADNHGSDSRNVARSSKGMTWISFRDIQVERRLRVPWAVNPLGD
jgi:hypothetical protein